MRKLNVLLSLTDQLRVQYKNLVGDYARFFSKNQGAFLGERKTYKPREGTIDEPNRRGFTPVATTVDEKFKYFTETASEFINALFSQEKTNASNIAKAHLVVGEEDWGEFTSLELLRLRSLIESKDLGHLADVLNNIPVRSDSELWEESDDSEFEGRAVYEGKLLSGVNKTTKKDPRILPDPNLQGKELPTNYQAPVVAVDVVEELGDYTKQSFSGQWSQREKAMALKRRNELLVAITKALKEANDVEALESKLTADKIFGYIFYGK